MIHSLVNCYWAAGRPEGTRPIDLVMPCDQITQAVWNESQDVLNSLHQNTRGFWPGAAQLNEGLVGSLKELLGYSIANMKELVDAKAGNSEELNELDKIELDIVMEDEECLHGDYQSDVHLGEGEGEGDHWNVKIE
ncbi:hypothetical protein DFH28DRAFT_926693 [Melampsora americana]|nr:hypothetical protein DFH28DRAFT_926693 [Melampsora americana]